MGFDMLLQNKLKLVVSLVAGFLAFGLSSAHAQNLQDDMIGRVVPQSRMAMQMSFAPLAKQASPAVVNIYTKRVVKVQQSPFFNDPFFRRFFGENTPFGVPKERVQGSLGSGVIVRSEGIVITNHHVIGGADSIRVVLSDRREFEADVVLSDERTDLAVLRLKTDNDEMFPTLQFSNSDAVEVGDLVLAIGNPFGVGQTVTSGIVSATARTHVGVSDFQFFIQTDAAINPGNSGGALVGVDGRLIGVNSSIYSRSGGNNGIGFAIPANMVQSVLEAALNEGEIVRPWFGARGQQVDMAIAQSLGLDRPGGVLLSDVAMGSPAEEAGLMAGDVILSLDGNEVVDPQGMNYRVATTEMGEDVPVMVFRAGEFLSLDVAMMPLPENPARNITKLSGRNPFQGVSVANLSPRYADELGLSTDATGVIVIEMDRRSPAARRQFILPGDVILGLNGKPVTLVDDLLGLLAEPQADYVYNLKRQGRVLECGLIGGRSFYCR